MAATCTCQLWRCSHRSNVISEGCAFPLLWTVKWGRLLFSCQELSFYLSSMISDPCFPLCYFHLPPTPPRSPVIICISQLLLFSPQLGQCQSLSRCLIGRCWILSITAAFPGCPDWEKVEDRHPLCCNHRDQRVMCVSISFPLFHSSHLYSTIQRPAFSFEAFREGSKHSRWQAMLVNNFFSPSKQVSRFK